MRISPLLFIVVFVLLCVGWVIYLEVDKRNFINSLPHAPTTEQNVRDSSKVQHLVPPAPASDEQTVTKRTTDKPPDEKFGKEQRPTENHKEYPMITIGETIQRGYLTHRKNN